MISQPFPCASSSGIQCSIYIDPPLPGGLRNILPFVIFSAEQPHLLAGKNSLGVLFAAIVCSVRDFIHRILRSTSPIKVLWINAPSIAAFMRGVSQMLWAWAVYFFADKSMNSMLDPFNPDTSVTTVVYGKRPIDTFLSLARQRIRNKFESVHLANHTHCLGIEQQEI